LGDPGTKSRVRGTGSRGRVGAGRPGRDRWLGALHGHRAARRPRTAHAGKGAAGEDRGQVAAGPGRQTHPGHGHPDVERAGPAPTTRVGSRHRRAFRRQAGRRPRGPQPSTASTWPCCSRPACRPMRCERSSTPSRRAGQSSGLYPNGSEEKRPVNARFLAVPLLRSARVRHRPRTGHNEDGTRGLCIPRASAPSSSSARTARRQSPTGLSRTRRRTSSRDYSRRWGRHTLRRPTAEGVAVRG
jgi:hypothetical protein